MDTGRPTSIGRLEASSLSLMRLPQAMNDAELLREIESLRNAMISVATGGPRIDEVNERFQNTFARVAKELARRRIPNPLPYESLWDWYGRWSSGDMPTYQSRRTFVGEVFNPLVSRLRTGRDEEFEPTGWARVDRVVGKLREQLAAATDEEDYQSVGLLCREAMISAAQVVFDRDEHPSRDGVDPSRTDAKRMLDAYISVELCGGAHDEARKHARAVLDLAVTLQHKRTAGFRDAAMCLEATTSMINIIAIISGRRDPA